MTLAARESGLMRKLARIIALGSLVAVVMATVLTVPASAQLQRVTVELPDGTFDVLILDLPEGITLDELANVPEVTGTPISVEPVEPDAPAGRGDAGRSAARGRDAEPTRRPAICPRRSSRCPASCPSPAPAPGGPRPARPRPTAPRRGGRRLCLRRPSGSATSRARAAPGTVSERNEVYLDVAPGDEHVLTARRRGRRAPLREADGTPTPANPGFMEVLPGPSRAIGVPNFIIEKFHVPPFLLPIYQAAGVEYGVRWEILAAINEIESDYGRNLNVSSAGAVGWMQFLPSTWRMYGVDGEQRRQEGPLQPGRRDLRRGALSEGRRLRG